MNDTKPLSWYSEALNKNKKLPWVIEKHSRRICFGYPGYMDEWIYYSGHETEEEARKELKMMSNFADPSVYESYRINDTRNEVWIVT